ncbi:MAG: chromate transporter [Firmicutes bacterium]|nr:chromate transporter [Bacillota bacterium]
MKKEERAQIHTEQQTVKEGHAQRGALLWQLFASFFRIGLFTIGGGLAMIPLLDRIAVREKKWFDEEEMMECIAVSQSLPGVVAVNMATYVGKRKGGFAGALLATLGVILPSFLIILAIANILLRVGDNPYLAGAFTGIKAAVCGLILATVIRLGKNNLKDAFGWIIALAAFVLIVFLQVNVVWVILGAAVLGIAWTLVRKTHPEKGGD